MAEQPIEETEAPAQEEGLVRYATPLAIAALVMTAAVAVCRALTHHPFFDECVHTRMLWLLSEGLAPHEDFWCNYPVLGYLVTIPLFEWMSDSARALLELRFLMLGLLAGTGLILARHGRLAGGSRLWGVAPLALLVLSPPIGRFLAEYSIDHFAMLAAAGSMALFFSRPEPVRLGAAAGLATLSVLLTPKYGLPLALGTAGMTVGALVTGRRVLPTLLAAAAGVAAAAVLCLALYWIAGASPRLNIEYAFLLMSRFKLSAAAAGSPDSLASVSLSLLLRNPLLLLLLLAGLAGLVVELRRRGPARLAGPIGVLAGVLATAFLLRTYMVRSIFPLLLCAGLFAPYAFAYAQQFRHRGLLNPILAAGVIAVALFQLVAVQEEFKETPTSLRNEHGAVARAIGVAKGPPAVRSLEVNQRLLDLIPGDELVVAAPQLHPLFRRDLTFITTDESPSYAELLKPDDPLRRYFDPAYLRARLLSHPPAYICLIVLENAYPPGWKEVCEEFLRENKALYTTVPGLPQRYFRRDLIR